MAHAKPANVQLTTKKLQISYIFTFVTRKDNKSASRRLTGNRHARTQ